MKKPWNPWLDIHRVSASMALNKEINKITKLERQQQKEQNYWMIHSPEGQAHFDKIRTYLAEMADCRSDAYLAWQYIQDNKIAWGYGK